MSKKIFFSFFLILLLIFSKSQAENLSDSFTNSFNPQKFPQTAQFYDAAGKAIQLSDSKGQVIVLNFWKATCRTCLIELPSLNALAEKYPDLKVIAVSQGDEPADLVEKVLHKERRLDKISVALDKNQALMNLMGGGKVPQTYLIDKDGLVRGHITGGADFNSETIRKQIEELF